MKSTIYIFLNLLFFSLFISSCVGDDPINQVVVNSAPSRLTTTVTDVQRKSVSISWSESIDPEGKAVSYSVYKDTNLVASGLTQRSFVFDNLPINHSFFVTIRAIDEDGQSEVSQVLEVSVMPSYPPTEFQVSNTAIFDTEHPFFGVPEIRRVLYLGQQISWTASVDPDGGTIVYDVSADFPPRENISLSLSLNNLGLYIPRESGPISAQGTNYVYVTARDEDGMTRTVATGFDVECYLIDVCPYQIQ